MALIIKGTKNKDIKIAGTDFSIPEIYGRVEFVGRANGQTLEIAVITYVSKQTYEENKLVFTDIPNGNINATIALTEEQSLETAHKYGKLAYEQLGYEVIIDLV